ncbi:MAG: sporulation integral membrane protein YlbJ [Clostridiales bacterium]|nr:sporulation integral membrane protein YlbJ [Clostridiales bacterium]
MIYVILALTTFFLLYRLRLVKELSLLFSSLLCATFIILLIIYSKDAISSCKLGISLWFNVVFPAVFPFLVICECLSHTNISVIIGKFFEGIMRPLFNVPGASAPAFFLGTLSGYPIGATSTLKLYEQGLLTKTEAERLITFTNNSGPLFVISAVGLGFFGSKKIGLLLYACHVLSAISVGIIFSFYKRNNTCQIKKTYLTSLCSSTKQTQKSLTCIFTSSVVSAINTMINIAGFIIFFSVIIKLLNKTSFLAFITNIFSPIIYWFGLEQGVVSSCISGLFEMTSGISLIANLSNTSLLLKLLLTSFLLGFAGLSIHSQIFSTLSKSDIRTLPFVIGKFLQGILSILYLILLNFYFIY